MDRLTITEPRRTPKLTGDPQVDNALWRLSWILSEITDMGAPRFPSEEDNESLNAKQPSE
jgi:hypothetical protein